MAKKNGKKQKDDNLMKRIYMLAAMALMILASGCGGGDGTTGAIQGYVKAPNGTSAISGARVTVQGTSLTATTNSSGRYTIQDVPSGRRTVVAVKGAFRSQITVSVTGGGTTDAPEAKLAASGKIGVVPGGYDNIGAVLTQLGIDSVDLVGLHESDVFTSPSKLAEYAVIFFACGGDSFFDEDNDSAIIANIQNYVSNGGRVYMSDWATMMVEQLFPGKVTMLGQYGDAQTVTGNILNQDLQDLLGKTQCSITYDLSVWAVIDSVANDVVTDITGTLTYTMETDPVSVTKPLLVHFSYGAGSVALTTFHNEANVTGDALEILKQLAFGF